METAGGKTGVGWIREWWLSFSTGMLLLSQDIIAELKAYNVIVASCRKEMMLSRRVSNF